VNIINPNFKIYNDNNIFTFRKKDYDNLLSVVKSIVQPVTEIDFNINEISIKNSKFSSGELLKTIKQNLIIKLQKGNSIIDISLSIPKLIDNNYLIINGKRKIPLFQLIDVPIITRGDLIKLRSNVATIIITKNINEPYINISFLGKKVPLALVLFAYYGLDIIEKRFNLKSFELRDEKNLMELLIQDLKLFYLNSEGYTQDDFILELGRIYSKYNAKIKGEDILYALDLIKKIDPFTSNLLIKESILEELLYALEVGYIDDSLYTNKRVRCFEYVIYSKISKIIFDLCITNRTARQPKFNTNSSQIISECNVSEIVQFDFSINPIEELTKLSRISLLGPGGFKRENIPKHLRDISQSMFGRVCPVDTPDRDNCGVLQNLIPNVKLDENNRFSNERLDHQVVSIPVSMIPFLEHDDQTRLQMASSQIRQSILLKDFDMPMIKSGCEHLYTSYTQFIKIAKKDGEVVYLDNKYLIVIYNDNEPDIFNINYRTIYIDFMDFMNINVKVGDKFKKGDILAESNYCKNGNIVFGKNLLTGIMIYYGNNYEDGIIISDRLVNKDVLTSIHFEDLSFTIPPNKILLSLEENKYKPLPNEFETINIGNPYAIIKKLDDDDFYSIFNKSKELIANKNFIISNVKLYINELNQTIPEYKIWVEEKIELQKSNESNLKKVINNIFDDDFAKTFIKENNLDIFSYIGKYKNKKEKINGIFVEMTGIYFRKIKVGDKIANRHGNKGIISRIVPHEKMPKLKDGRHLDICINPLGIISRMNIGQVFELHLTMSLYDLKNKLKEFLDNNESQDKIKNYLLGYINIIDKTKDKWYLTQFINELPDIIDYNFIDNLVLLQPPFESCKLEDIKKALKYTNTLFKYKLYDPLSKMDIQNDIAVGYIYFLRMVHIAEEKLSSRGIGTYSKRTLQPLKGRKYKGGQKLGEMETACMIGHDVPTNLFEFITTKSDCIDAKNKYIKNLIDYKIDDEKIDNKPESVKLLNAYLTVLGIKS
jgi:DNA-directed RNA polymerase beta subunit